MNNLSQLIANALKVNPGATFGTVTANSRLTDAVETARAVAVQFGKQGIGRGSRVAYIGTTSSSYLAAWMAGQLAGIQTAMINPTYPNDLLREMLTDLQPDAIVWVGREPGDLISHPVPQFDACGAWLGCVEVLQSRIGGSLDAGPLQGAECVLPEIAGFMHTSGTTGRPKFCTLSNEYFIRLGRFIADTMCLARQDVVFAPLPMFHINPLGYGVIGSLTAGASVLGAERFSASAFWDTVKDNDITALVMHLAPINIIKSSTTPEQAAGHKVRTVFCGDPSFLDTFSISIGVSCYGSTEAGGLCHAWHYRAGDPEMAREGPLRYGGRMRYDMAWMLADTGEIYVREKQPNVMMSGYFREGKVTKSTDHDGWFHTGDRGRLDEWGNLVFIERFSESIRVNGEYVPMEFVEETLRKVSSLGDFALWSRSSDISGQEAVIYTSSESVCPEEVKHATADLPKFMRPRQILRIQGLPRDSGVGKIQRQLLSQQAVLQTFDL